VLQDAAGLDLKLRVDNRVAADQTGAPAVPRTQRRTPRTAEHSARHRMQHYKPRSTQHSIL
jgi:hypothetical protein